MNNTQIGDTQMQIKKILLKNASFWQSDVNDKNLYYVDVAAIGHFAYQMMEYAATIFGASLPVIEGVRYIKTRRSKAGNPAQDAKAGDNVKADNADFAKLRANLQNNQVRDDLVTDFKAMLEDHGWPQKEASADVQRILEILKG